MQNNFSSDRSALAFFPVRRAVTRERVLARTRELAELAGRTPPAVAQSDYEQAKRELTGEADLDRQLAVLDAQYASGGAADGSGLSP